MKPTLSWSEYQRLELIPASVRRTPTRLDRLSFLWQRFRQRLRQRLIQWSIDPQEIEIWSVCDPTGKIWWNGYDPKTGRSRRYASEHEIRTWIEQHYLN